METLVQILLLPLLQQVLIYLLNQFLYPVSEVKQYEGSIPTQASDVDSVLARYGRVCD
jgi:hypothetical protein